MYFPKSLLENFNIDKNLGWQHVWFRGYFCFARFFEFGSRFGCGWLEAFAWDFACLNVTHLLFECVFCCIQS